MSGIGRGCGLTLALVVLLAAQTNAQTWLYPETILAAPRGERPAGKDAVFLGSTWFGGEAARVLGNDDDHRWIATIGGAAELVRWRKWTLLFESAISLVADPGNNIGFNPRALMWEEGVLVGLHSGAEQWQFGLQHRCKHDIDNIELLRVTGREEERALIYSSLMLRWRRDGFEVAGFTVQPLAELHGYVFVQDQRFPVSTRAASPNVEDHIAAARLCLDVSAPIGQGMRTGAFFDTRGTLRKTSSASSTGTDIAVTSDASHAEVYAEIRGQAAALRVFLRAAFLSDTFIRPLPRRANLYSVGVRIVP